MNEAWDASDYVTLGGIGLFVLLVIWLIARARRPRYIIDEHGERQRVIAWNRGQPVYDPKTWQQRIHEEAIIRRKRRLNMLGSFGLLIPVFGVAAWLSQYGTIFPYVIIVGGGVGIIQLLVIGVPALWQETLYQLGHQGIQGAKVLDKRPQAQPGRELVETQKAHGDARLAGEAEALALLRGKR